MKEIPTARDSREGAYQCGYNPDSRTLSETVTHWEWCESAQCRQSLINWERFKAEILARYPPPVESLADYPDAPRRPGHRMGAHA